MAGSLAPLREKRQLRARPRFASNQRIHFSRTGDTPNPDRDGRAQSEPEGVDGAALSVGGKLHGFWYAFGAHDGFTLWEAPDNVSMAAVALAISGGGALSSLETTVLLTVDETMEALGRVEQVKYRPPGT